MADLSLGAQCVPSNALALPYPLTRTTIECHVEALIALLDHMDGDSDFEEDNEDCCPARDDTGGVHPNDGYGDGLPGDPLDAEDFYEDRCEAGMVVPIYGVDQAAGPIGGDPLRTVFA